ncbi:MAG: mechanosensitive ion channel family protein, partial [Cyanobacteria bacterium P01_H01_bin.130]
PSEELATRVEAIEAALRRAKGTFLEQDAIAEDGVPREAPIQVQQRGGLPVLYYGNRYLFTVTNLDANLYQTTPLDHAPVLQGDLQAAFYRAWQERQPEALQEDLYQAIALWIGTVIIVLGIHWFYRYHRRRYRSRQRPDSPNLLIRTRLINRRQKHWHFAISALLRVSQAGLLVGATLLTLARFPDTRPWHRWAISHLQGYLFSILAIAGTYILTTVTFSIIDRLLGEWLLDPTPIPQRDHRLHQRIITLSRILKSITAVTLAIATLILILVVILRVDVGPVIAGAGLVGVALSLASQNLIRDAIEGILILVEDRYAVGDVVVLKADEIYGLVENITLRVTQLRDPEQRLITVPNGEMRIVANLSSRRSQADLKIPIAYSSDLDKALDIITEESWALVRDPDWQSLITGDPLILGADEFTPWGIIVRVWIETVPLKQWDVAREYRRRIKRALDKGGIEMARSRTETQAQITWDAPVDAPSNAPSNALSLLS